MDNISQMGMYANVHIKTIDKNKRVISEIHSRNKVTRYTLYAIARFLNGDFNSTTITSKDPNVVFDRLNSYIPHYIAFGNGTSIPTVNDTGLSSEIKIDGSPDRISISSSRITSYTNNDYVKLTLRCYIGENKLNDIELTEAGLFSSETGNSCMSHVLLKNTLSESAPFISGERNYSFNLKAPLVDTNAINIQFIDSDGKIDKDIEYTITGINPSGDPTGNDPYTFTTDDSTAYQIPFIKVTEVSIGGVKLNESEYTFDSYNKVLTFLESSGISSGAQVTISGNKDTTTATITIDQSSVIDNLSTITVEYDQSASIIKSKTEVIDVQWELIIRSTESSTSVTYDGE